MRRIKLTLAEKRKRKELAEKKRRNAVDLSGDSAYTKIKRMMRLYYGKKQHTQSRIGKLIKRVSRGLVRG